MMRKTVFKIFREIFCTGDPSQNLRCNFEKSSKIKIFIILCLGILFFSPGLSFAQNTVSELFDLGQSAQAQGDIPKAIDFYEKAIESDPDFASAYSALGSVYLDQNGNVDDIVWLFEQAANLEPQNPEHYTNMCRAYFQAQKHDWAESACLKALSIDPNAGAAKMTLAWVYLFGKSQPGLAVKYFKEIVEKVPNPKIYYGLGMAYARNNEQANALDIVTKLRGMGEETLASQLEKMMRISNGPVTQIPGLPATANTGRSEIVSDKPPAEPVKQTRDPQSLGKIRIQLKASLPTSDVTSVTAGSSEGNSEDSYGPEDYKPLTLKERQERVRNMRGSTGKASGKATVTTQTQSAPQ